MKRLFAATHESGSDPTEISRADDRCSRPRFSPVKQEIYLLKCHRGLGFGYATARILHVLLRRGSCVAAWGACAVTETPGDRISQWRITRRIRTLRERLPARTQ